MFNTVVMTQRVGKQLLKDRRFIGLSLVAPVIILYFLKIFFDSLNSPLFNTTRYVMPVSAFIVHFLTYILCALVLVRERTTQTLTRMFVNGFRRSQIILGYIGAYTLLATVMSLIVLIAVGWMFNLNYDGWRYLGMYLVIWLLAVISIALGILVSNFARTEGQVFPFIPLLILPSVFLSGMLISVDKLPEWAQWVAYVTPLYYANKLVQTLNSSNGSLFDNGGELLALVVYGLIIILLAMLTLRELD